MPQTGTGQPFPGLAYTLVVDVAGDVGQAWDLDVRVWHSAAVVDGVARNASHVGILWIGDQGPHSEQIYGLAKAIVWCERRLGRKLDVEGHGDVYPTACPGPAWPAWKDDLTAAIAAMR